jgi:hypothetical protein
MLRHIFSPRTLIGTLALLGLLLACSLTFRTPAAHADSHLLVCTGTQSMQFSPGVTYSIQSTNEVQRDVYAPCLDTSDPTLTGGSGVASVYSPGMTCNTLDTVQPFYQNFYWNDLLNSYSQVYFDQTTQLEVNGTTVITSSGIVSGGYGKGDSVLQVTTLLNLNLGACSSPTGMVSISGAVVLTFN